MGFFLVFFSVALSFVCTSGLSADAKTVKIGPQDVVEDPVYIYRSVVKSYFEYKAAKEAAELAAKLPANLRAKAAKENEHVCYDGYGCFFKNGTYGNFWRLPLAPEEINTVFYLYTSAEQEDPEVLDFHNATTLLQSSFRADKPTIIMIHGFGSGAKASWNVAFRAAIFRGQPNGNYIFTDWSKGAKAPDYWGASANTQMTGMQVAKLIAALNTNMGTNSSSFHIIGHSLGAHAAGFTGHRLNELGQPRVAKITGLDPAGPIFEDSHSDAVLSIGDADFVAGIHSNAATLTNGGLGLFDRVGDIDFYPNGGQYQPSCPGMIWGTLGSIFSFDWGNVPDSAKCNHNRAIEFAMDSVDSSCSYMSYGCDTYSNFKEGKCYEGEKGVMGIFGSNIPAAKRHFLVTKGAIGYCAHPIKISLQLSSISRPSQGSLFVTLVAHNGTEESVEQMADDEALLSSQLVVEIVASKTKVSDLVAIKVKYVPACGWISCWPDFITVDKVEVDSLESDGKQLCGGLQVLYKDDAVSFPLASCSQLQV